MREGGEEVLSGGAVTQCALEGNSLFAATRKSPCHQRRNLLRAVLRIPATMLAASVWSPFVTMILPLLPTAGTSTICSAFLNGHSEARSVQCVGSHLA